MTARPGSHQAGLGVMRNQIQEQFCRFLPLGLCTTDSGHGLGWAVGG